MRPATTRKLGFPSSILILFWCAILVHSAPVSLTAERTERPNMEYNLFFTELENVFLFHPETIKEVFINLVRLKGNRITSRRRILKEVLSCDTSARLNPGCRIEYLNVLRKKRGVSSNYFVPVNFTRLFLTKSRGPGKTVTAHWKPVFFKPPAISISGFLQYINAAADSRYYQLKEGIHSIQLNTIFEKDATFTIDKKQAYNLLRLYKRANTDLRDSLVFVFDSIVMTKRGDIATFDIYLRIKKIKINNRWFKAVNG